MGKFDIAPVRAEIVMQDGHQTVRLPDAFRVEGSEITIRREGDKVILEPVATKPRRTAEELAAMWARIDALGGADFPDREQPAMQERDFDW